MKILISLVFLLITTSSFAVTFDGKFIQGSFILGKTEPGSEVFIDKQKVKVTSDGYFAFGLGRDRKNDVVITINEKKIVKKVFKREYKIQRNEPTTNFFLMNFNETKINSDEAFEKLANDRLLLRKMKQYKIPNALRLTIGDKESNELFVECIRSIFK